MLENKFYKITERNCADGIETFHVELIQDCEVYKGHFPGEPVSPGVCNIQMMKECAEKVAGKHLMMYNLQQARLTTLVTPSEHKYSEVRIKLEKTENNIYKVRATLGKGEDIYLDLKAEMR